MSHAENQSRDDSLCFICRWIIRFITKALNKCCFRAFLWQGGNFHFVTELDYGNPIWRTSDSSKAEIPEEEADRSLGKRSRLCTKPYLPIVCCKKLNENSSWSSWWGECSLDNFTLLLSLLYPIETQKNHLIKFHLIVMLLNNFVIYRLLCINLTLIIGSSAAKYDLMKHKIFSCSI